VTASSLRELYRIQREAIADEIRERDENGCPKWTYDEIGQRRGISRERVRQIAVRYGLERRAKRTKEQEAV
jgi:DNA-directed RNA polymerase sigma subunit (sigma70/sigma32)